MAEAEFDELTGKLLLATLVDQNTDDIVFITLDGRAYHMHHPQDCCETVTIDDICGELDWLQEAQVIRAEERSHCGTTHDRPDSTDDDGSQTWTFYELVTTKGAVTIRWYGTSNGYYSESVCFTRIDNEGGGGALRAAYEAVPTQFKAWAAKMGVDPRMYLPAYN